jgi:hypothetical protein
MTTKPIERSIDIFNTSASAGQAATGMSIDAAAVAPAPSPAGTPGFFHQRCDDERSGQNAGMPREQLGWEEMRTALSLARGRPSELMRAIANAPDRASAALALVEIVGCRPELADQLLDVPLSEFIASSNRT